MENLTATIVYSKDDRDVDHKSEYVRRYPQKMVHCGRQARWSKIENLQVPYWIQRLTFQCPKCRKTKSVKYMFESELKESTEGQLQN
jgi:hypothetical protein